MDDIYQEHILDHYQNPRYFKGEVGADSKREANASCGDVFSFWWDAGKLWFSGQGCAVSTAAASILLEKINDGEIKMEEVAFMGEEEMQRLLGIEVTAGRQKCMMLVVRGLGSVGANGNK